MEILYLLIPVAMIILGLAIGIFFWAVNSGQYDDLEGPAYRILMDDDIPVEPPATKEKTPAKGVKENSPGD